MEKMEERAPVPCWESCLGYRLQYLEPSGENDAGILGERWSKRVLIEFPSSSPQKIVIFQLQVKLYPIYSHTEYFCVSLC